ncbi:GNAT family N-acetyltransferase [uncultured Pseudodesulfovibrio sp.]|uniref:GNAT family N-acetyltransferase n=1 Tax=uncultured Pseudodesulfovibrio sp. TaxID=2035858 RepID=UPI0029C649F1|nr:GNAT family N-acetyltransferase [uncultured Pseudodesulfovibrio sp.]
MNILAAVEGDYHDLVEVWEASVRATHGFLSEEDIQFFKPLILNDYFSAVELYYIKDSRGTIHGFVGVAEQKVEMLFLDPRSRGTGLGKFLLNFAIAELGANTVDVNEQNPSAVGFYEHMGFKVVGRSSVDGLGKPFPLLHMELGTL